MNKKLRGDLFFIFSAIFLLQLLTSPSFAAKTPKSELKPVITAPSQEMPLGEKLHYKITWLRIPVGYGELWLKEKKKLKGRDVYYVIGKIETNKVLSAVFPIKNEAYSWIDAVTLESVRFQRKIEERFTKADDLETYDSAKGKGVSENFKTGEKTEFGIKAPAQDVFSIFYWARRQNLVPGESIKSWLVADKRNWELEVIAMEREKVKIKGLGKLDTILFEPRSVQGKHDYKNKCFMNLTTDEKRIPVRIMYKAPFGPIVGTLQPSESFEGS